MSNWKEKIPETEILEKVTGKTVDFAERFGKYLAVDDKFTVQDRNGRSQEKKRIKLTTSQLRKFFGEIKRQQAKGFDPTDFVLLKPKLAYAVGRAKDENAKINDFYFVLADGIEKVKTQEQFKNFIKIFEAIVAYHKAVEESRLSI
jgi:CRISPR type III-A-associated protein Csm2